MVDRYCCIVEMFVVLCVVYRVDLCDCCLVIIVCWLVMVMLMECVGVVLLD